MNDSINVGKKNKRFLITIIVFAVLLVGGTLASMIYNILVSNGRYNTVTTCLEIDYDITGTREILAGKEYEYVLTPNALCSFAIDNQNVTVEKMTTYSITIKCNKPNEIFKLKAMIGDIVVAEKTIITMN